MKRFLILFFVFFLNQSVVYAENIYETGAYQFTSQGLPAWTGVISGWQNTPVVHLYDSLTYKGHATYVSRALKTGITFKQFIEKVRFFKTREYLPFTFYDLRKFPLLKDGKKYTWAVQIVNYDFKDNPVEMSESVLKTMQVLSQFIENETGKKADGIFILDYSEKSQFSTLIRNQLSQNNFGIETLLGLLKKVKKETGENKDSSLTILNKGVACGYLRFFSSKDAPSFQPHDIVVFEKLPYRVPLVNGIITLEAQTPLSHVNLLAINRKTVNIFLNGFESWPELKNNIGKLVIIDARQKEVSLKEVSLAEAEKIWESQKINPVVIPKPDLTSQKIINLHDENINTSTVGAKASNYSLLLKKYPDLMREGYALPFSFYFEVMEKSGAASLVDDFLSKKDKMSVEERDEKLFQIRERIMQTHLEKLSLTFIKELNQLRTTTFFGKRIRLRSSTNCEDLAQFNGAGLYISKGVNPTSSAKTLAKKVLEIYASVWTSLAFEEREFFGIDHKEVGMSLLVHEAFSKEVANGVALTIPDENGEQSIMINIQPGESSVTNPEPGVVPESILFGPSPLPLPLEGGGKKGEGVSYHFQTQSSLGPVFYNHPEREKILLELKNISLEMDLLLKEKISPELRNTYGIDIEFKIMNENGKEKLFIKQGRLLKMGL